MQARVTGLEVEVLSYLLLHRWCSERRRTICTQRRRVPNKLVLGVPAIDRSAEGSLQLSAQRYRTAIHVHRSNQPATTVNHVRIIEAETAELSAPDHACTSRRRPLMSGGRAAT